MKNSNDTIGNQTRDLPTCRAVPLCSALLNFGCKKLSLNFNEERIKWLWLYRVRQKYLTIWRNCFKWNRWRGEFVLERSSSETQSISVAMERWSLEHRPFAVETYFKKQRFCLDSEDISSALQYSSERLSLVAILLPLRKSQDQRVRKETKVYEKKPRTTADLKQNIRKEVAAISPNMLLRVTQNSQKRLREFVDNKGRHLMYTVFKKWTL